MTIEQSSRRLHEATVGTLHHTLGSEQSFQTRRHAGTSRRGQIAGGTMALAIFVR
jgi:hypothetical protein